jgi:two-component system phosphate regulon response regulator PhoB
MNPILIVEDDEGVSNLVACILKQSGFSVTAAMDGANAMKRVYEDRPPLVILDLMLPDMDGNDICRTLKDDPDTRAIPVLMLTGKAEEADRIKGFESGADDYVTKPFSPRELALRVKAILRRTRAVGAEETKVIQAGDIRIDPERHEVSVLDRMIQLTTTEFKLLVELASKRGKVQTREYLLDQVWGYRFDGYAKTVDVHICRLRERLGPHATYIEGVRGVGYRFREENE